jgi:hypothetical protein
LPSPVAEALKSGTALAGSPARQDERNWGFYLNNQSLSRPLESPAFFRPSNVYRAKSDEGTKALLALLPPSGSRIWNTPDFGLVGPARSGQTLGSEINTRSYQIIDNVDANDKLWKSYSSLGTTGTMALCKKFFPS